MTTAGVEIDAGILCQRVELIMQAIDQVLLKLHLAGQ
jgi:hypothetical protein